jgi:hypothetical protein
MDGESVETLPAGLFLPVVEALFTAEIGKVKGPAAGTLRAQATLLLPRAIVTARTKKCEIQVRCLQCLRVICLSYPTVCAMPYLQIALLRFHAGIYKLKQMSQTQL